MTPLEVEFVKKPPRLNAWLWAALVGGVCVLAVLAWRIVEVRATIAAQARQAYAAEAARAVARMAAASPPAARMDTDEARQMFDRAAFDTAGTLKALEGLRIPGVHVTSLVVDTHQKQVRVDIEIPSPDALTQVLDALNAGEPNLPWRLVQMQASHEARSVMISLERSS